MPDAASPVLPKAPARVGWGRRTFDWLFGYDYFLAHRSADGKRYATALHEALTGKGNELDCFLDVKHYGAGLELTGMQSRALKKTARLILVVSPRAHDVEAIHVLSELREFRQMHPHGAIVPIGTWETLSEANHPESKLLPLLPHLPNNICILETAPDWLERGPSPQTVAKLLNDFSEERGATRRLKWIRRAAMVLLVLLIAAVGFAGYAVVQQGLAEASAKEAVRQLASGNWQMGQQARGEPFAAGQNSAFDATWRLLKAAESLTTIGDEAAARNALRSAAMTSDHLVATLLHDALVWGMEVSPDGRRVLTHDAKWDVRVWDRESGEGGDWTVPHHTDCFRAMFVAGGQRFLTESEDNTTQVWNVQDGKPAGPPMVHEGQVLEVTRSGNDERLLTRAGAGVLQVWKAVDGARVGVEMTLGEGGAELGMWSGDSRHVLGVSRAGVARFWDAETGLPAGGVMACGKVEGYGKMGASFSLDLGQVLIWGAEGGAQIWEVPSGKAVSGPLRLGKGLRHAVLAAGGAHILARHLDDGDEGNGGPSRVQLWDAKTGAPVGAAVVHLAVERFSEGDTLEAVLSADGKRFLTWDGAGKVHLWDAFSGAALGELPAQEVAGAAVSPDGRYVLSWGGQEGSLWDTGSEPPTTKRLAMEANVATACFSKDGGRVLLGASDGHSQVWDVASGRPAGQGMKDDLENGGAEFVAGGETMVTWWPTKPNKMGLGERVVRLWGGPGGGGRILPHPQAKGAVCSQDGERIVSWDRDGTLRVWERRTGEFLRCEAVASEDGVYGAAFSPDGKRVVSWQVDGVFRLWDVSGKVVSSRLMNHGGWMWGAAYSKDGRQVFSRGKDGKGRVWDAVTGELLSAPLAPAKEGSVSDDGEENTQEPGLVLFQPGQGQVLSWTSAVESGGQTQLGSLARWDSLRSVAASPPVRFDLGINSGTGSADGRKVLTWSYTGECQLWDADQGVITGKFSDGPDYIMSCAAFTADGTRVIVCNHDDFESDDTLRLRDSVNGQQIGQPMTIGGTGRGVVFSPDGELILAWDGNATARLWSSHNSALVAEFRQKDMEAATFSPSGDAVITCGGEGLKIWDISVDASVPMEERMLDFEVRSGTTLAADNTVRLLSVADWQGQRQRLAALRGGRPNKAVSPPLWR